MRSLQEGTSLCCLQGLAAERKSTIVISEVSTRVCAAVSCVPVLSPTRFTYRGGLGGEVFLADMGDDAGSQSVPEDVGHGSKSIPR